MTTSDETQATGRPNPEEPRRRSRLWRILGVVGIVVVSLVVVAVVYAVSYTTDDAAQAQPGDCAKVSATTSTDQTGYEKRDCAAPDAGARVTHVSKNAAGACPDPSHSSISVVSNFSPSYTVCYVPNWVEGACYDASDLRTACPGRYQVVKVVPRDSPDGAVCDTSSYRSFPEPAMTVCTNP
ncbi:LppU/SCO3897 family protein [Pseudonocardia spinosispora]|uniref:LppU/SCO3897 family protein n=1 Tax=Pseudonocardia spinosispora TaxID=103441 RepID=UPI00040B97A7|nr:hypothetical protein [Pseudonocardia spinosispora]